MCPTLNQSYVRQRWAMQPLLGAIAVMFMLFGQTLAVSGLQSSSTLGWIEICGTEGVKLVQAGQEAPMDTCDHCDYCTVQFSDPATGPYALNLFSAAPDFLYIQFSVVSAEIRLGVEQYWAANRGPPLASEEQMNTDYASMAATANPVQRGIS